MVAYLFTGDFQFYRRGNSSRQAPILTFFTLSCMEPSIREGHQLQRYCKKNPQLVVRYAATANQNCAVSSIDCSIRSFMLKKYCPTS
jgi:hypothetical protein